MTKRLRASAGSDTVSRLAAIDAAYRQEPATPEPDIDQMLDEIERGYLGWDPLVRRRIRRHPEDPAR